MFKARCSDSAQNNYIDTTGLNHAKSINDPYNAYLNYYHPNLPPINIPNIANRKNDELEDFCESFPQGFLF